MAGLAEKLELLITANTTVAQAKLRELGNDAEKNLGKASTSSQKWGDSLVKVGAGVAAVGAVTLVGLSHMAQASEEAHRSQLLLSNTLANMPKLAGESADSFNDLADAIQSKTAADSDQIVAAEAMLGTFNLTGRQIRDITPLVVDYARKFNTDLTTAAITVGKALDGQIGALKRNGVSIDEAAYKADRFTAVQKALADQVGGFAEAEGRTFSGQIERLKNELGDLEEGIGVGVVQAFSLMLGGVESVTGALDNLSPGTQAAIGEFLTFAAAGATVVGGLSAAAGLVVKASDNFARFGQMLGIVAAAEEGAAAASTSLTASLGPVGIAAAAVAATVAFVALVNSQDDGARATEEYTAALQDQNGKLQENVDKVTANALAHNEIVKAAVDAGISFETLGDTVRKGSDDFGEYRRAIGGDLTTPLRTVTDRLRDAGAESTEFGRGLLNALQSGQLTAQQVLALITNVEGLHNGFTNATTAAAETKTAIQGVGAESEKLSNTSGVDAQREAMEELRKKADETRRRYDDLLNAQRRLLPAALRAEAGPDEVAAANARVAEAAAKLGTGATAEENADLQRDYNDALRAAESAVNDYAEAQVELAEEQAKARGESLTADQTNLLYYQNLLTIAESMTTGAVHDGLMQHIADLEATAQAARILKQQELEAAAAAGNVDAQRRLREQEAAAAEIGNFPGLASGGSFGPGFRIAGEYGPELQYTNPDGGGYILNAADTKAAFAASKNPTLSSWSPTVNIYGSEEPRRSADEAYLALRRLSLSSRP